MTITFSCEIEEVVTSFRQDFKPNSADEVFPVLEKIVRTVKNSVKCSENFNSVIMRVRLADEDYGIEVMNDDEKFSNSLAKSFYGLAATIMNHLGIEGYEFPKSFKDAIFSE